MQGLLQSLPIPSWKWQQISMYFIGLLPLSDSYNYILVIIDQLMKMAHFIPTTIDVTTPEVARLFMDNIYRLHGMPKSIINNRDTCFMSKF